jgi:hypothetical protein
MGNTKPLLCQSETTMAEDDIYGDAVSAELLVGYQLPPCTRILWGLRRFCEIVLDLRHPAAVQKKNLACHVTTTAATALLICVRSVFALCLQDPDEPFEKPDDVYSPLNASLHPHASIPVIAQARGGRHFDILLTLFVCSSLNFRSPLQSLLISQDCQSGSVGARTLGFMIYGDGS